MLHRGALVVFFTLVLVSCRGEEAEVRAARAHLFGSGSDAGMPGDGGPDAGAPDAGSSADAAMPDAGMPDGGMPDAGSGADAGVPDGGMPDGGMPDGGGDPDAGLPDGPADGVAAPPADGGHPPGTIPYDGGSGQRSWWTDSDGVDPEFAGCHIEWNANCGLEANPGRHFGELCQTNDVLVETNPGKDVCHDHPGDIGHPYVVPCDAWCKNLYAIPGRQPTRRGIAAMSGRCQVIGYLPCGNRIVDSARCLCSDGYYGNGEMDPPSGYPGN